MPIHRKATKGATVLTKRTQLLRKYYKRRSCKPLYEKLKNNNSYLAKALSREKQNCQSLFSQNIALIAEVQELRLGCSTRDNIISNILSNAKETLKMLVTMSGYTTNTISICQEFAASNANLRLSSTSIGKKESSRRLSTKSPAKGVVKPMVSGHTITKPTINLSRVNMQHINNSSRLSDIQEIPTPNRSQEMNETRSPISVSIPITQLRYEDGRACRMPERLSVPSSRINNTIRVNSKSIVRRKRSHSKRTSGSYSRSRSGRWSDENVRNSAGYINRLGSPRVELNDVSKLLQNSQSINIRRLFDNGVDDIEIQESSHDAPHDTSNRNVIISETQVSINSSGETEPYEQTSKESPNVQTSRKTDKEFWRLEISKNSRLPRSNWEDPLEGPSWLFNNNLTMSSRNNGIESNNLNVPDINDPRSQSNGKTTTYNDESSDGENMEEEALLPNSTKYVTNVQTSKRDLSLVDRLEDSPLDDTANDNFCTILPTVATSNCERNFNNENNDDTRNLAQFVTLRREHSKARDEETEDFTLLFSHQPARNMHFDISELQLPVLEGSMLNAAITNEVDTEVTTAIQRITNIQMPNMSKQSMNESYLDPTTTIKLPLILLNDYNRMSALTEKTKRSNKKHSKKKSKKAKMSNSEDDRDENVTAKSKAKQINKVEHIQDPSTAKVVLEKLSETRFKPRISSLDDMKYRNSNNYARDISNEEDSPRDSESNTTSESSTSNRPRRKKAPVNLKEPSLTKKLRRDF